MNLASMQGPVSADTVVTVAARDAIDWIVAAAAGSVALCSLLLVLMVAYLILQARAARQGLAEVGRKLSEDPAVESLRRAAENVARVSDSVRGEVERFSGTVARISDQIERTSEQIEERVEEFNALLEVMQREAEEIFVDGASRARGVRAGLGNLRGGATSRRSVDRRSDGSGDEALERARSEEDA